MTNCAYARGAKLCRNRISILQSNRKFSILLFEIRKCCLLIYTTCESYDEIMKIAQVNFNKKFHAKKLSMNLSVVKREK
jgi:hypothetical protein